MGRPPPRDRQMVGNVGVTDRPMAMYTPGREGVYYEPGGSWLAILVLVALGLVTFGAIVLYFMWR